MSQPLPQLTDRAELATPAPSAESALARLIRAEIAEPQLSQTLDATGQALPARHWQAALAGPLLAALSRDGKRFRSRLVEVAYSLGSSSRSTMPAELPLLVEALHTGSLIIDDIEDDSSARRGKAALHVVVGVPIALNAGNWLYFLPHRVLELLRLPAPVELELRQTLDRAALRCHYGQALDLGVRLGALPRGEVWDVVSLSTRLKTGSLLELAAEVGSIASGAGPQLRVALARFARGYGTALQMLDDLSGLYRPARAHKANEDLLGGRPTWPWAWLSRRLDEVSYSRLQHQAQAVERGELEPEVLAAALRCKLGASPESTVYERLRAALEELERSVESRDLLDPLADEVHRLEHAYV
jgi:geranylgeranyl pyrophosphate synthase